MTTVMGRGGLHAAAEGLRGFGRNTAEILAQQRHLESQNRQLNLREKQFEADQLAQAEKLQNEALAKLQEIYTQARDGLVGLAHNAEVAGYRRDSPEMNDLIDSTISRYKLVLERIEQRAGIPGAARQFEQSIRNDLKYAPTLDQIEERDFSQKVKTAEQEERIRADAEIRVNRSKASLKAREGIAAAQARADALGVPLSEVLNQELQLSDKDLFDREKALRSFAKDTLDNFELVQRSWGRMQGLSKQKTEASDQAMIISLFQILDPSSVVSLSEADSMRNSSAPSWLKQLGLRVAGGGRVTDQERDNMMAVGAEGYRYELGLYNRYRNQLRNMAVDYGLNPDRAVLDYADPALQPKEPTRLETILQELEDPNISSERLEQIAAELEGM